jgi:SET domain-containing protein
MDNFVIKDTATKGQGLFATKNFGKNEVLFKFVGNQIIDLKDIPSSTSDRFLQVGPELYINIEKHFSVFVNHACNPNTYVKIASGTAFLLSLRPISIGDELTYDYALTSTDSPDTWSMECKCAPFNCRKLISGFRIIPEAQQKKLIAANLVPKYVI